MMGDETTGRLLAAQQAPPTTKLIDHRIDICPIPLIVPMHASQLLAFERGVGLEPTPHVIAMILAPRFWIFQGHLGQGATPRRGCGPGSRVRLAWLMRPSRYLHLPRGGQSRNRTDDTPLFRRVLYHLSYLAVFLCFGVSKIMPYVDRASDDEDVDVLEPFHLPMFKPAGPTPKVRADCLAGGPNEVRPCNWITCEWYLPRVKADAKFTCVLDVADLGGSTLEEVGELLGITRERVRQIEARAVSRIKKADRNVFNRDRLKILSESIGAGKGWDW